jgi:hypothetical protein
MEKLEWFVIGGLARSPCGGIVFSLALSVLFGFFQACPPLAWRSALLRPP